MRIQARKTNYVAGLRERTDVCLKKFARFNSSACARPFTYSHISLGISDIRPRSEYNKAKCDSLTFASPVLLSEKVVNLMTAVNSDGSVK